jgi:DnaK suppressor protein
MRKQAYWMQTWTTHMNNTVEKSIWDHYPDFVRVLERRRAEIVSRQQGLKQHIDEQIVENLPEVGDVGDASVADSAADYFLKLADNDHQELREIDLALGRIRQGTYGECSSCGNPIGMARLNHLPYARLCVDCQTAKEARRTLPRLHSI